MIYFVATDFNPLKRLNPARNEFRRNELFGSGGGQELADELNVPLLGQLPLVQQLREGGDDGHPIAAIAPESETGKIFHEMARKIAADNKPRKKFSKFLKVNG